MASIPLITFLFYVGNAIVLKDKYKNKVETPAPAWHYPRTGIFLCSKIICIPWLPNPTQYSNIIGFVHLGQMGQNGHYDSKMHDYIESLIPKHHAHRKRKLNKGIKIWHSQQREGLQSLMN